MLGRNSLQILIYALFCLAVLALPMFVEDAFLLNKSARYLVLGILAMALSGM